MADFHFLRPGWLLALPVIALLLWRLQRRGRGAGDWREVCDPLLLPHVVVAGSGQAAGWPVGLAALIGALAVLALAGPAWERLPTPVFRNLSALVVVLDLSPAMDAADLKPNRLERARFRIEDILRARKDGQTALVVYAGDAFTVTPLTDDAATITGQLKALGSRLMPVAGSRADLGLEAAGRLLKQAGARGGDMLLVTSGEGLNGAEEAVAGLRREGYRVSVLGVGTAEGGPVPSPEGGFEKDARGNILVPRLDAAALRNLAGTGGGLYRTLDGGPGDLEALLGFFDRPAEGDPRAGQTVHVDQWREEGIWLLPLLLPLAALGFRRGWLGLWLLLALAPVPQPAAALEWRDLWLTPDQQGQRELQAGHAEEAAGHFRDPEWKAAADFQAGHYEQAAEAWSGLDTARANYNRGNALAKQGQLDEALKAYDRALRLDPKDEDAGYNRKLVEDALRRQEEEKKQREQQEKDRQQGQDQGQQPQPSQGGKPEEKPGQDGQQGQQGQGQAGESSPSKPDQGSGQGQDQSSAQHQPREGQDGDRPEPRGGQEAQTGTDQGDAKRAGEAGTDTPSKDAAPKPEPSQAVQAEPQEQDRQEPQPVPGSPTDRESQAPPRAALPESAAAAENRQAEEQWLRRIPDDPGGLLKRKFDYQYRQRQQRQHQERTPW